MIKLVDKLHAKWSKRENDILIHWPLGVNTKSDASYLSHVFSEDFQKELRKRGYDITTIKFSVEPAKGNQRFGSQRVEGQVSNPQNSEEKKKKKIFVGLSDHEPEKDGWIWVDED